MIPDLIDRAKFFGLGMFGFVADRKTNRLFADRRTSFPQRSLGKNSQP